MNETLVKAILTIMGIVFLFIGFWGFFEQPVFDLFAVNWLHNLIHLVTGATALWLAGQESNTIAAVGFVMAAVYAVVTFIGFATPGTVFLGILPLNTPDNYLHLVTTALFGFVALLAQAGEYRHA